MTRIVEDVAGGAREAEPADDGPERAADQPERARPPAVRCGPSLGLASGRCRLQGDCAGRARSQERRRGAEELRALGHCAPGADRHRGACDGHDVVRFDALELARRPALRAMARDVGDVAVRDQQERRRQVGVHHLRDLRSAVDRGRVELALERLGDRQLAAVREEEGAHRATIGSQGAKPQCQFRSAVPLSRPRAPRAPATARPRCAPSRTPRRSRARPRRSTRRPGSRRATALRAAPRPPD